MLTCLAGVREQPAAELAGAAPCDPIPLLRRGSWYESLDLAQPAAPGLPAVSLAPQILIRADARHLRRQPVDRVPDRLARARMLAAAWERFTSGQVRCAGLGSQSYAAFSALLRDAAGLPAGLVDRWCRLLDDQLTELLSGADRAEARSAGCAVALSLVALPANTFTCLYSVFDAALSGTALWVRPSTREPFSALRLICAMLEQGWPAELIGYYPSQQSAVHTLVEVSDRQIVYGGPDIVAALRGTPSAQVHGPLRVCALVPGDADPEATAARLRDLIAADAGRFCTALRVILCLGDPAPVAATLGNLLDSIPLAPPDPGLPMAAIPDRDRGARIAELIQAHLGTASLLTSRPVLCTVAGSAYLAPTLLSLPASMAADASWTSMHPLFGFEAPFPIATIIQVTSDQAGRLTGDADITHRMTADEQRGSPR